MTVLRFTDQHEWISIEGDVATTGITGHAAEQLGDVVFVELPEVGRALEQGGEAAVVESVKAASDVYAPVSGEVIEVNEALVENPALINEDAEGGAWFMKIKMSNAGETEKLMDKAGYDSFLEGQS